MATKRNPDRFFHPYAAAVNKKTLRLEQFMEANEEDESDFGEWRLKTLETHIKTLQDQVLHMESDWDVMWDDISTISFNRISQFVEDSMATADGTLA